MDYVQGVLGNMDNRPKIAITTLPEVVEFLSGRRIRSCVNAAWQTVYDEWDGPSYRSGRGILGDVSRSSIIVDHWYDFAIGHLFDDVGVTHGNDQGQRFLNFESKFLVRFKHVNSAYLSWNAKTRHSLAWNAQIPMKGLPECPRLEFGYQLDDTATLLKRACMLQRVGKDVLWVWQVLGERDDTFGLPMTLDTEIRDMIRYRHDNLLEVPT